MTDTEPAATAAQRRAEDFELAQRVVAGDRSARARFVQHMEVVPRILSSANAQLDRPLSARDLAGLVRDTLLLIARKLETYTGRTPLATWAHRACYVELMKRVRAQSRVKRKAEARASTGPGASPAVATPGEYERVEIALAELDPLEADVIRLKHYGTLSFPEIGAALDVPASTARTGYYRGLTALRRRLTSDELERHR